MDFTLVTTLLCCICVSASEFHTVEVQPGEEATLQCSNFTNMLTHIFWFRLNNGLNASHISSLLRSDINATLYGEFQNGTFEMTSNTSTIFLKIKHVDLSDFGLYFCGFKITNNPVIVSATHLKVQEEFNGTKLMSMILISLIVFLVVVIISLAVKIRKLHSELCLAQNEEPNPQNNENHGSDSMNYGALSFLPKAKTRRRPASERELEPNVVYAATR